MAFTGEGVAMARKTSHIQSWLQPYAIGLKLRALRTRKRLTLARLAAETGLSTALLSKLETDRAVPTLPTLAAISRVYGVGLGYFFAEPRRHVVSITRKLHLADGSRSSGAARVTPLNGIAAGARLSAQVIEFEPGNRVPLPMPEAAVTGFCQCVFYVIEGKLALESGGAQELLEAGDCLCVESEMTIACGAADKHPCRVLAVLA